MSMKIVTFRLNEDVLDRLKNIQDVILEATGDKLGYSKILTLYLDVIEGNIDMNTILLHYDMVKDSLLVDGRKTRWEKDQG